MGRDALNSTGVRNDLLHVLKVTLTIASCHREMHERFIYRSLFLLIQEYFDCFEDKNTKRAKITRP